MTLPESQYPALQRITFVDRTKELSQIKAALDALRSRADQPGAGEPPVFLITGPGGIGKTELLKEVLRRYGDGASGYSHWLKDSKDARVLDFYHPNTHSPEGLMTQIKQLLTDDISTPYLRAFLKRLTEMRESQGKLAGLQQDYSYLTLETTRALVEGLNDLGHDQPVILAFDTAEQLLYLPDTVQHSLGISPLEASVEVWSWLVEQFLPRLTNVAVLLAGRAEPELPADMRHQLHEAVGQRLIEIKLLAFDTEAAAAYWERARQTAIDSGNQIAAKHLAAIDADRRAVILHFTAGQPILLALTFDYVARAERLMDELKMPLAEALAKTGDELRMIRENLRKQLVRHWLEQGLPAERAISLLGWARRGIDIDLLSRLMNISPAEADELAVTLRGLSFVKVRPDDKRLFLQDEMHQLLWDNVLCFREEEQREAFEAIVACYHDRLKAARDRLEVKQTEAGRDELHSLMTERVYYHLRKDPAEGFETYYRYMKELTWDSADPVVMELRDELLLFRKEFDDWVQPGSPLTCDIIDCELALRWVDRAIRRGKYAEAIDLAHRTRTDESLRAHFAAAGPLVQVELDLLEGRALIYLGQDLPAGQALLARAQRAAQAAAKRAQALPGNQGLTADRSRAFDAWRAQMLQAETANDLGYAARVQGFLRDSLEHYTEALKHWRQIGKHASPSHANTLNNAAWTLAELGSYQDALRLCLDGLDMRRRLGPEGPMAFSLNTLGLIEVRNDQPHRAMIHCKEAFDIFCRMAQPRGIGLSSIALAEAYRRTARIPEGYSEEQQVMWYEQAGQLADQAVTIFTREVPERLRLVEALIELGCDYRDWAHRANKSETLRDQAAQLAAKAERIFRLAAQEAQGGGLQQRALDIRVNWSWLYYYMHENDQARERLNEALNEEALAPYIIRPGQELPSRKLPQPGFWAHLGKAHLLRGNLAMRRYAELVHDNPHFDDAQEGALVAAAEQFMLALEYDHLFGDDYRDLRRAEDSIYERLKGLNLENEFPAFIRGLRAAARRYHLERRTHLEQFIENQFRVLDILGDDDGDG